MWGCHMVLALLLSLMALNASAAAAAERPLRVLFLGDNGHHHPADRAAQLVPVLANRGIDISYTQDANVLAGGLAGFDALILYANTETITPQQEAGLLAYVETGGGFVPLHCASFCFQNSPKFIALVGGQFASHGTGDFETKIVAPQHPIMQGFTPFVTWDETYIHNKLNAQNRTLLQVRAEAGREEPWTWVRTQGHGRVFYTAYGHDERTWMNPGFVALVERGIRWAANKGEVFDSRETPHANLKPFEYAEALLPNYTPGGKWGELGEPIRTMQLPLEPGESQQHLVVPPGFTAKLYAAEPQVAKPIALAWDHRGRLWVAETFDYPNNKQPAGGHDRITICEDTDGDAVADTFTVFAEGLSIPTSLAFGYGGVIVHQAPDTLFLKDTDGDGQADVRNVLLHGWSAADTHAGPSNLRYAHDNWYYGMVGYAGFNGEVAGEKHKFERGFYRFQLKPESSLAASRRREPASDNGAPVVTKLEFLRNVNNNAWGVGLSEEGLVFGSTANGCPSVFLSIPNRYYENVRGWSPRVLESISPSNRYFPITDKVRQVDFFGGFTSAAGHALYTARNYPPQFWNRTAFVSDPTGHLTATFVLKPNGTDFTAWNDFNLLASDDEWTAPIAAEVGPDGNVWVIDWYNYVVQHNPTPAGFETGKGNAYVTPLRDKRHGRIYRVVHEQGTETPTPQLDPNDPKTLLAALSHPNMFWRLTAQRLLVERGQTDVVPRLVEMTKNQTVDATGLCAVAVHALWTLEGLGAVSKEVSAAALAHPSPAVRRAAVMTLPRNADAAQTLIQAGLLNDPAPQVRLASLLALADMPAADAAGPAVGGLLGDQATLADRWLPDAATAAAAGHAVSFLKAVSAAGPVPPRGLEIVGRVAEHLARGGAADSVGDVLTAAAGADPAVAAAIVSGLATGWPEKVAVKLDPVAQKAVATLLTRLPDAGRGRLVTLADRWGVAGLDQYMAELAQTFVTAAGDAKQDDPARIAAAAQLVKLRPNDAGTVKSLAKLLTPQLSPVLSEGFVNAIGGSNAAEAGEVLAEQFGSVTPAARPAVVRVLLTRPEWTRVLMRELAAGTFSLGDLSLDQQQALASHPDAAIAAEAKTLLATGGGLPDANRQKVIEELLPLVSTGGDAARGKLVFTQQCAKCHRHNGEGNNIGPDLTGMAAHPREELLIHILDPSRSVEGNFRQYTVVTTDGLVRNGLLGSETKTSIELIDVEGKRQPILRDDIEELIVSNKSVMPEGFEKQVPPSGIADLLAFLTRRGKYLPLDLRKAATITSVRGMFTDKNADAERLIFSDWTPKEFAGVPFLLVDPQDGRVPNVVMLHGPSGVFPPRMPQAVSLPVHSAATAIHLLGGVAGWAHPIGQDGSVSMIVRLHYADGSTEDHPLRNGVEIADYIRVVEVPGSRLAFKLRGQQVRFLSVRPDRNEVIQTIELVKGPDATAPVVMAVTVETANP